MLTTPPCQSKYVKMKQIFLKRLSISFFSWTQDNAMACNPKKCNELILCKMVAHDIDPVLGVTLQSNHRFNEHNKVKLLEANKCVYVIRRLPKEGY